MAESYPHENPDDPNAADNDPQLSEEERLRREEWARADEWFEETGLGTPELLTKEEFFRAPKHDQESQKEDDKPSGASTSE